MQRLLWVDVETTGLNPDKHSLLEVAAVITDGDCKPIHSAFKGTVCISDVESLCWNPIARDMHEGNGLVDEIQMSVTGAMSSILPEQAMEVRDGRYASIESLENQLQIWYGKIMESLYPDGSMPRRGLPLAGSNPGFDRAWLEKHLPLFASLIHYRSFDMNTLYYFFEYQKDKSSDPRPHRALDDLLEDIARLQQFRSKKVAFH